MVTIRRARPDDAPDVVEFTRRVWSGREVDDYVPDAFEGWVESDDEAGRTYVAEADGRAVGVHRVVMLSGYEAWCQGMRVDPDYRGRRVGVRLTHAGFDWARDHGATVARNLVFSWNAAGLGLARAAGFDPVTAFRWVHPDPDPDADPDADVAVAPDAAWVYWGRSDARSALAGLALDADEPWAVSELTRDHLARAADETWLGVVQRDGTRGFAYRVGDRESETDDGAERWAEYGVGTWSDLDAARSLLAAIGRDAAELGADGVRVLAPDTAAVASDAVTAGARIDEGADFVLAADLTCDRPT